jgi:hypothetical protein
MAAWIAAGERQIHGGVPCAERADHANDSDGHGDQPVGEPSRFKRPQGRARRTPGRPGMRLEMQPTEIARWAFPERTRQRLRHLTLCPASLSARLCGNGATGMSGGSLWTIDGSLSRHD